MLYLEDTEDAPLTDSPVLRAYWLPRTPLARVLDLQDRLHLEVRAGERPAVICCEHPEGLTVGREGGLRDLPGFPRRAEAELPKWKWVARGGGCWWHVPGQIALYAIQPVLSDRQAYAFLRRWLLLVLRVVRNFGVEATDRPGVPVLWAGDRPLACVGLSLRRGVSSFGAILNDAPALDGFYRVRTGAGHPPMTSLERESRKPIRPGQLREALLLAITAAFGYETWDVFTSHPWLTRPLPDARTQAG